MNKETSCDRNRPPAATRAFVVKYQFLRRYLDIDRRSQITLELINRDQPHFQVAHYYSIRYYIEQNTPNTRLYASNEFSLEKAFYTYAEVHFATFQPKWLSPSLAGRFILALSYLMEGLDRALRLSLRLWRRKANLAGTITLRFARRVTTKLELQRTIFPSSKEVLSFSTNIKPATLRHLRVCYNNTIHFLWIIHGHEQTTFELWEHTIGFTPFSFYSFFSSDDIELSNKTTFPLSSSCHLLGCFFS